MKNIILCILFALSGNTVVAGDLLLRLATPETQVLDNGTLQYCTTAQIKAADISLEIGSASVFFSYNPAAIAKPVVQPLQFSENNLCAFNGTMAAYRNDFSYLEMNGTGEGNYAILLLYPQQGCPTVVNEWIDIADFCFEVVNIAADKQMQFNATYTQFNTDANNGELHNVVGFLVEEVPLNTEPDFIHTLGYQLEVLSDVLGQTLQVRGLLNKPAQLLLYNAAGQCVLQQPIKQVGTYTQTIDVSHLLAGNYILAVENAEWRGSKKMVLLK